MTPSSEEEKALLAALLAASRTPQKLPPLRAPQPLRNLGHARERSIIWRLFVRLAHLMTQSYFPGRSYGDTTELRMVLVHVLLPTAEGTKAPNVSELSRLLGLSRPTVQRRLQELIRYGYVERVGTRYVATAGCDIEPYQVERQAREIVLAAEALLRLAQP